MASSAIAELFVSIRADMGDVQTGLAGLRTQLGNVQDIAKKVGTNMTKYLTLPLLAIGGVSVKAAADLEATGAKFETVFEGMTDEADKFITEFKKLTPATQSEARSMASGMQDLLIPMGIARGKATEMTGEFMNVAGALTNFNSATYTAQEVTAAMQSAITGEYSSLKGLGIQLDVDTVKQKAVEQGLAASTKEVSKQAMAQVLLSEIYAQSSDALAAYNEESLDTTTKMGLLKVEAIDVAAQFGEIMIPILQSLVESTRKLVEWFGNLTDTQKKIVIVIGAFLAILGPVILAVVAITSAITTLTPVFAALGPIMATVGGTMSTFILGPIGLAVAAIAALIFIGYELIKHWDDITAAIDSVVKSAIEKFNSMMDFLIGLKDTAFDAGNNLMISIREGIAEGIKFVVDKVNELISSITDRFDGMLEYVLGLKDRFFEAGANIIDGIKEGITSKITEVTDKVKELAQGIRDFFPFSPAKTGPLKDINKIKFGETIGSAIDNGKTKIQASMNAALQVPTMSSDAGRSANIAVELDGRTIASAIGQPLVDNIRVRTGLKI